MKINRNKYYYVIFHYRYQTTKMIKFSDSWIMGRLTSHKIDLILESNNISLGNIFQRYNREEQEQRHLCVYVQNRDILYIAMKQFRNGLTAQSREEDSPVKSC